VCRIGPTRALLLTRATYTAWEFAPAFKAFKKQRADLLAILEPLPAEDWERTATVTGMLRETYEPSARYHGDWLAGHERAHWKHIERIVAAVQTTT
jgi:hypothetical protein